MPFRALKSNFEGELLNKTVFELQEMLARERMLLSNQSFVQKLPDKGAKLEFKIQKLEEELISKKEAAETSTVVRKRRAEVEQHEWNLHSFTTPTSIIDHLNSAPTLPKPNSTPVNVKKQPQILDSDDSSESEEEAEHVEEHESDTNEAENTLKMIATSQISQHQPKKVTPHGRNREWKRQDCPLYIKMLANTVEHRSPRCRFLPNRTPSSSPAVSPAKNRDSPSPDPSFVSCTSSPARSIASSKDEFETCSSASESENVKKNKKWDDSLLPPPIQYGSVKCLNLEESFQLNTEQYERLKELQSANKPSNVYAHDAVFAIASKYSPTTLRSLTERRKLSKLFEQDQELSDEISDEYEENQDDHSDEYNSDRGKNGDLAALSNLFTADLNIK